MRPIIVKKSVPRDNKYFYAYSEKMILASLAFPLLAYGTGMKEIFDDPSILTQVEFPETSGDASAQYGVLIVHPQKAKDLSACGLEYVACGLQSRQLNPQERRFAFLDWQLPQSQLADDYAAILNGFRAIPYRQPMNLALEQILPTYGYTIIDENLYVPRNSRVPQTIREYSIPKKVVTSFSSLRLQ